MNKILIGLSIGISLVGAAAMADQISPSFTYTEALHEPIGGVVITLPEISNYASLAEATKTEKTPGVVKAFKTAAEVILSSASDIEAARRAVAIDSQVAHVGVRTTVEVNKDERGRTASYKIAFYDKDHPKRGDLDVSTTDRVLVDRANAKIALKTSLQSGLKNVVFDFREEREEKILAMIDTLAEAAAQYAAVKASQTDLASTDAHFAAGTGYDILKRSKRDWDYAIKVKQANPQERVEDKTEAVAH